MGLIYDLADPQELQGFVRAVLRDVDERELILSNFLPNVTHDDITFRYSVEQVLAKNAAKVRAWDTEAPIGKRPGVARKSGELVPISEKLPLGEEMTLRLRSLRENGDDGPVVDAIFNDADNLARAIARRIEMLRGEVLETAEIAFDENGVIQSVSFGRDSDLEPTALAGTAMWSDLDDSDPVANLQTWSEIWASFNGGARPAVALTSSAVIANLLRNESLRTLAGSLAGTPGIITENTLRSILQAFNLPVFVAYDVAVQVDDVETRVISDDKVLLLGSPDRKPGNVLVGPTAEGIKLATARQISVEDATGLVATVEETFDPPITWTKVSASTFPVMANPNSVLVADVQ